MGTGELLVMMLTLPMVALAGCLRWYVSHASGDLEDFRTVVPGGFEEPLNLPDTADVLPACP